MAPTWDVPVLFSLAELSLFSVLVRLCIYVITENSIVKTQFVYKKKRLNSNRTFSLRDLKAFPEKMSFIGNELFLIATDVKTERKTMTEFNSKTEKCSIVIGCQILPTS